METKPAIYTVHDLIGHLGGPTQAAEFFSVSKAVVNNWAHREGRLPSKNYIEHQARLAAAGIVAHPGIWYPELRDRVVVKTASGWRL